MQRIRETREQESQESVDMQFSEGTSNIRQERSGESSKQARTLDKRRPQEDKRSPYQGALKTAREQSLRRLDDQVLR